MAKKKRITGIAKDMIIPFGLAGGAIGSSIVGGALQSKVPAGMKNPVTAAGSTMGKFVGPSTAIASAGIVMKQMNNLNKKIKRRY